MKRLGFSLPNWPSLALIFSSGTTVQGNIVSGTVRGGVDLHGGSGNSVINNVFVNGSQENLFLQRIDASMHGNLYYNNIIVYEEPTARCWQPLVGAAPLLSPSTTICTGTPATPIS